MVNPSKPNFNDHNLGLRFRYFFHNNIVHTPLTTFCLDFLHNQYHDRDHKRIDGISFRQSGWGLEIKKPQHATDLIGFPFILISKNPSEMSSVMRLHLILFSKDPRNVGVSQQYFSCLTEAYNHLANEENTTAYHYNSFALGVWRNQIITTSFCIIWIRIRQSHN